MRVLVTGAAGFVGSHAVRALAEARCDVHALARPGSSRWRIGDLAERITVVEADVSSLAKDRDLMATLAPEACLHLAWYTEPGRYLGAVPENLNCLRAGLELVEALAETGCRRLVVAGTCAEYDPAHEPLREESPLRPATPYARAKHALHLVGGDIAEVAGMAMSWARLFFLYGPAEHPDRVVPAAARALLRGQPFPATAGEQVRDYLHVADAAEALVTLIGTETSGSVNICSGTPVAMRSVLETVERLVGAPGLVRFGEVPYPADEPMRLWGSNERLRALGWNPRFGLEDGLADAVESWMRNGSGDPPATEGTPRQTRCLQPERMGA